MYVAVRVINSDGQRFVPVTWIDTRVPPVAVVAGAANSVAGRGC